MGLLDPGLATRALERALAHGGDLAEVYAEDRRGFGVALDDGRVERPQSGREVGVSVRVVRGEASWFGHVDGLAEGELLGLAASVAGAVRGEPRGAPPLPAPALVAGHEIAEPPEDGAGRPQGRPAARLRGTRPRRRSPRSPRRRCRTRRAAASSRSSTPTASRPPTTARACGWRPRWSRRARRRVETGTDTRGGHAGFELLADGPERVAEQAARQALTLLDAVDAPSGRMPVVVGNGFGGVLLHEAVGHGLEADAVQKRASVYAGRHRRQLAEHGVTAYDDGRRPNEWGSDGVDDEGTPTQRTTIIEDGRLTSYLYDLQRARADGVASTGNGRRESFRHLPCRG